MLLMLVLVRAGGSGAKKRVFVEADEDEDEEEDDDDDGAPGAKRTAGKNIRKTNPVTKVEYLLKVLKIKL